MPNIGQDIVAAFHAGRQLKRQRELDIETAEDRKLERQRLTQLIKLEELNAKVQERQRGITEASQMFQVLSGQPARTRPSRVPPGFDTAPSLIPSAGSRPAEELLRSTVTFPFSTGDVTVEAPTKEDLLEKTLREAQFKRLGMSPTVVGPGETVLDPLTNKPVFTADPKVTEPGTPEEAFVDLRLRTAMIGQNRQLPPEEQLKIREQARKDWVAMSRDPELGELRERILGLQVQAAEQRLKGAGDLTPQQLSASIQLSNSLKSHPAYTDMLDIDTGMKGVEIGLAQQNGFGDITAINAFQRMVDPGATVREGDVALLQSGAAFLQKLLSDYPVEKLRTGAKLPAAVRQSMLQTALSLYERRARNYNDTIGNQYRMLSKGAGIPFELVGQTFDVSGTFTLPDGTVVRRQPDGTYR